MSPYSEFALTEQEKASELVLACRAVPWSDCEIKFLEADEVVAHPSRRLTCKVVGVANATHDIRVVLEINPVAHSISPRANTARRVRRPAAPRLLDGQSARRGRSSSSISGADAGRRRPPYVSTQLTVGDAVKVAGPCSTSYLREKHTGRSWRSPAAPAWRRSNRSSRRRSRTACNNRSLYFGTRAERDLYLEDHFVRSPSGMTASPSFRCCRGPMRRPRHTGFLADAVRGDFGTLDGVKAYRRSAGDGGDRGDSADRA